MRHSAFSRMFWNIHLYLCYALPLFSSAACLSYTWRPGWPMINMATKMRVYLRFKQSPSSQSCPISWIIQCSGLELCSPFTFGVFGSTELPKLDGRLCDSFLCCSKICRPNITRCQTIICPVIRKPRNDVFPHLHVRSVYPLLLPRRLAEIYRGQRGKVSQKI